MISEETIERLLAEHRPPDETLEEDRISGPFVEGKEMLVGVGHQVYRATIEPPAGWMMKASDVQHRDENGTAQDGEMWEIIRETFAFFHPAGLMEAVTHPLNARYIIGAWANVAGAQMNERMRSAMTVTVRPVDDNAIGKQYYEHVRARMGVIGRAMAEWDQLPLTAQERYIKTAKRREEQS